MKDKLDIELRNIRGIKSLKVSLNLRPGIYAITGKNASGKSSLIASLSAIFYRKILSSYFQNTPHGAFIKYQLEGDSMEATKKDEVKWDFVGDLRLNGFYEGSIIHGNRFRDANYGALYRANKVKRENLTPAEDFVKENLGIILKDDANHYESLYRLKAKDAFYFFKFRGSPYFTINKEEELIISQFSLSTGENLLISLLHSIHFQLIKKSARDHYIVLLDEIELALHPQALVRLVKFLGQLSRERNIAIYFSTHSVELVRQIAPNNIYYLEKHIDNTVEVINPCYPSYATRNISFFDGYDLLVLVEDHLARTIIEWIQRRHDLNSSKLIHILPSGGWENTLSLHSDILDSELLGFGKSVISVLDGDIEQEYNSKYKDKGKMKALNVSFLPIPSIEKFLLDKLILNLDLKFFRHFGDSFFKKKSLDQVITDFNKANKGKNDGKALFGTLVQEATSVNRVEEEFVTMISNYIVETEDTEKLAKRLKNALK
ncbi:ATP-dependent nuclease [Roseivirga pacifica]|uniref:ATP-dependent nuclease n=1 Tax=Roseivirga pacifica TaxID=1267423 RepID=UPI003BB0C3E7